MKILELSKRLQMIADLIPPQTRLVDIGTDHGYLPTYLAQRGDIVSAIACDIREGPLSRAKLTVEEYDCANRIELRLSDGLVRISPEEVDVIAIAGMGGETIIHILEDAPWIKNSRYRLILQPMSTQPELRRWLCAHQLGILEEHLVLEDNLLYTIFVVGLADAYTLTDAEQWVGRQTRVLQQPLRNEYFDRLLVKIDHALNQLQYAKHTSGQMRYQELQKLYQALCLMKEEWESWQSP